MIWDWLAPSMLLLVGGSAIVWDAWHDHAPRTMAQHEPWWLRQMNAPFWVHPRTKRERTCHSVAMEAKR